MNVFLHTIRACWNYFHITISRSYVVRTRTPPIVGQQNVQKWYISIIMTQKHSKTNENHIWMYFYTQITHAGNIISCGLGVLCPCILVVRDLTHLQNRNKIKQTSYQKWNTFKVELAEFLIDRVMFSLLKDNLINNNRKFHVPVTSFICDNLYLLSILYFIG